MRTIMETPDALVKSGRPQFGIFRSPFRTINMLDSNPFGLFGLTPKSLRRLRLKEWQHFSVVTPDHFIGIAAVDAKFMGVSWCYAFSRKTRGLVGHERQLLGKPQPVSRELWNSRFTFRAKDYEISVYNHLDEGKHFVSFSASGKDRPTIRGSLEIIERLDDVQPLISVLPIGGLNTGRIFYSHKVPCPVSGEYEVGGARFVLDPSVCFAILDIHKSYYPFRTWWKWATFAARDAKKNLIGANLTEGVAMSGDDYNENCIWHGKKMSLLSSARFDIPANITDPWRITTTDGRAILDFKPQGLRSQTLDLKVVASWYMAPLGLFSGSLTDDDGVVHKVKDAFGICEHHRVTW